MKMSRRRGWKCHAMMTKSDNDKGENVTWWWQKVTTTRVKSDVEEGEKWRRRGWKCHVDGDENVTTTRMKMSSTRMKMSSTMVKMTSTMVKMTSMRVKMTSTRWKYAIFRRFYRFFACFKGFFACSGRFFACARGGGRGWKIFVENRGFWGKNPPKNVFQKMETKKILREMDSSRQNRSVRTRKIYYGRFSGKSGFWGGFLHGFGRFWRGFSLFWGGFSPVLRRF